MKAGKIPPQKLRELVLNKLGQTRPEVMLHAGIGEDCAALDFGGDLCVVSTDPITGTAEGLGSLGVIVSCNDVASNGAEPVAVQVVLLLPEDTPDSVIAGIMGEIDGTCKELNIEVIGGHTELTSKVTAPVVSVTAFGKVPKGRLITSSGARVGDQIVVTKGVGIEGTALLAQDFSERLDESLKAVAKRALKYRRELSVVKEGMIAARTGCTAMHDITEGGLYGALWELSEASGVGFTLWVSKVPVREETALLCGYFGLDPLGLISSGSMLITAPDGEKIVSALAAEGINAAVIGEIAESERWIVDGNGSRKRFELPEKDEFWRFLAENGD